MEIIKKIIFCKEAHDVMPFCVRDGVGGYLHEARFDPEVFKLEKETIDTDWNGEIGQGVLTRFKFRAIREDYKDSPIAIFSRRPWNNELGKKVYLLEVIDYEK